MATAEQRKAALAKANAVRSAQVRLKADIRAGLVSIIDLILDPPTCILNATVYEVALWTPHAGRVRVDKALRHADVSAGTTFTTLSPHRRAALIAEFTRLVRRYP